MGSSQKFIARNRAPRVQIEYDVELYGAEKKVQLPFVMGVMSDLLGKSQVDQPAIGDRKFLEIDVDNFDDRMRAMAPRAAFTVPNTLTGNGNLAVDLTFESLKDFSPGAIASKVDALRPLLEARTQLQNLMAYMDGKAGAEALIEQVLANPAILTALTQRDSEAGPDAAAALASLRGLAPVEQEENTDTDETVLSALAASEPEEAPAGDMVSDVLGSLAAVETEDTSGDGAGGDDALAALAAIEISDNHAEPTGDDVLAGISRVEPTDEETADVAQVLSGVEMPAGEDEDKGDTAIAALDALKAANPEDAGEGIAGLDQILAEVPEVTPAQDAIDDVNAFASLHREDDLMPEAETSVEDVLGAMEQVDEPLADSPDVSGILDGIEPAIEVAASEGDPPTDVLDVLKELPPDSPEDESAGLDEILGELPEPETQSEDQSEDILNTVTAPEAEPPVELAELDDLLADILPEPTAPEEEGDEAEGALQALAEVAQETLEEGSSEENDFGADVSALLPEVDVAGDPADDLDALLATIEEGADDVAAGEGQPEDDLDSLLGEIAGDSLTGKVDEPVVQPETSDTGDIDGLADVRAEIAEQLRENPEDELVDLSDLVEGPERSEGEPESPALPSEEDELDSLLDELSSDLEPAEETSTIDPAADVAADPLDDILSDLEAEPSAEEQELDDLLGDLVSDGEALSEVSADDGLDDLLADLEGVDLEPEVLEQETKGDAAETELDDLLEGLTSPDDTALDDLSDLDDLLGEIEGGDPVETPSGEAADKIEFAYGTLSQDRPTAQALKRNRFRLAILGDFSGRAARGKVEIGDSLAARKPVILDPDTVEDVIESFATELVLPLGKDGSALSVKLEDLDALHPDELYENVELFSELVGLRRQLENGATAAHAEQVLRNWASQFGTRINLPKRDSTGTAVPADKRLSEFQHLIGDAENSLRSASPIEELLAQVVGPYVKALPDPDVQNMKQAVDQALTGAMRLVLHHPEFQAVEAQWRSLDLIARSIETDDTLDVVLYDVSAEELAADLATADDLSGTGVVRLLTEAPLDDENGRGGYSALIGLYTFEETPPHAELLGRIARVAAHVDAPFLAAISPGFLTQAKEDRPALVTQAWDTLQGMTEAGHLALISPRFLLRRPYGAKTDPCDAFTFEEFSEAEGLRGMLWGNPVVLAAILLARSYRENGKAMNLGSIMSLGDMPYHYVTDRFGDQVALPCTERNVDLDKIAVAQARCFNMVSSVKGRDEIRLTSFNSLKGGEILGPWSDAPLPDPSPPDPGDATPPVSPSGTADETVDELTADLDDLLGDDTGDPAGLDDLDSLLASFGDDNEDAAGEDDMDAELAALLDDL